MKCLVRKKVLSKKQLQDLFQTDPRMSLVLIDWIKKNIKDYEHMRVIDPCCGHGAISNLLSRIFYNLIAFDFKIGRKKRNYLLANHNADIIAMNPPYSNKYKFMNKAFKEARYIFVLLPLNTRNYNIIHDKYENKKEYVGYIKMSPKIKLTETGINELGGNSMYCWLIWDMQKKTTNHEFWLYNLNDYGKLNEINFTKRLKYEG